MKHICNSIKMLPKRKVTQSTCLLPLWNSWYVSSGFNRAGMIYASWGPGPQYQFFLTKRSFFCLPSCMHRYSAYNQRMVKSTRLPNMKRNTSSSHPWSIPKHHTWAQWWHQLPATVHENKFASSQTVQGTLPSREGSSWLQPSPSLSTGQSGPGQEMFLKEISCTWKFSL